MQEPITESMHKLPPPEKRWVQRVLAICLMAMLVARTLVFLQEQPLADQAGALQSLLSYSVIGISLAFLFYKAVIKANSGALVLVILLALWCYIPAGIRMYSHIVSELHAWPTDKPEIANTQGSIQDYKGPDTTAIRRRIPQKTLSGGANIFIKLLYPGDWHAEKSPVRVWVDGMPGLILESTLLGAEIQVTKGEHLIRITSREDTCTANQNLFLINEEMISSYSCNK